MFWLHVLALQSFYPRHPLIQDILLQLTSLHHAGKSSRALFAGPWSSSWSALEGRGRLSVPLLLGRAVGSGGPLELGSRVRFCSCICSLRWSFRREQRQCRDLSIICQWRKMKMPLDPCVRVGTVQNLQNNDILDHPWWPRCVFLPIAFWKVITCPGVGALPGDKTAGCVARLTAALLAGRGGASADPMQILLRCILTALFMIMLHYCFLFLFFCC